jgi:predicted AAA+ superfamily ATPase
MNENHSRHEFKYKPRWIFPSIREAVRDHPVVVLTGARQVGKSTLLRKEFPDARYVTLDDYDALHQAETDPAALWAGTSTVIVDEVQKSPTLLSGIKGAVDTQRHKTTFILSGSANLLLMRRVSETLAGRAIYFTLRPFAFGEQESRPPKPTLEDLLAGRFPKEYTVPSPPALAPLLWRGFLPPLFSMRPAAVTRWWEGYVATYLERDLRDLSQVDSLVDFRRLMELLSLRNSHVLNQSALARDAGLSQPSVHRHINLLETSHLLIRLPAFARNRTRRLVRSPKTHWLDPGLAAFLSGLFDSGSVSGPPLGPLLESMVLSHLQIFAENLLPRARLFYWRTSDGHEVDFILEHGRRLIAVEVKATAHPSHRDADPLRLFMKEHPETSAGLILHSGSSIHFLDKKIIALPWTELI